jgi:hypothetical protein
MQANVRRRLAGLILSLTLLAGGCSHGQSPSVASAGDDDDVNVRPSSYKPDILNALRAYLKDPTGIRDAGISDPALKAVGGLNRYVVCVRFNAKKGRNDYAGEKEVAAVFIAGRLDRFAEMPHESANDVTHWACEGAAYTPFPELGKLSR